MSGRGAMSSEIRVGVYDQSRLLAIIEAPPATAWRSAVSYVKALAHADGVVGGLGWYQTANNMGFARGIFRCVSMRSRQAV